MKKWNAALLCFLLALSLGACGSSGSEEKDEAKTTAAQTEVTEEKAEADAEEAEDTAEEESFDEEESEEDESFDEEEFDEDESMTFEEDEEEAEPIAVADYDPFEYVTLGEYTGLDVDMLAASVSEDDLETEIEGILEEDAEEVEKTDGAEPEDLIAFTYTLACDGEELESSEGEELEITLGYTEFGEEVDEALTGAKAGDTVTAQIELDDSYDDDLAGKTATYTLQVARVYTYAIPELTDDYVKEHTDFDTVDAYREDLREKLLAEAELMNRYDAGETALSLAAENATVNGYPQDLYDSIFSEIEEQYIYFFGEDYSSLISEDDMAEGVIQEVNAQMVLKAIIQKEGLTMTEEQFQDYLKDNLTSFGETFDTPEELAEAGGDPLRETAQRELVTYWLLERDNVTELTQDEYDAKYNSDFILEDDEETDADLADADEADEEESEEVEAEEEAEEAPAEAPAEELDED